MAERVAAVREIAIDKRGRHAAADEDRVPAGDGAAVAARGVPQGLEAQLDRGLPLPGDLRVHEADLVGAARRATSSRRSGGTGARSTSRYARSKNLTPYDVLIIASMIEKEAVAPKERPLVAAVIYNRLQQPDAARDRRDDPLRAATCPPTESLTKSELESDDPYNTRKRLGLPPTPIANPGLASMQAAAHPAKVDYLYFVAQAGQASHHFFTAS